MPALLSAQDIEKGKAIYTANKCQTCHAIAGKGNKKFQPQFDVLSDGWRQPGSYIKPIVYLIGVDDKVLSAGSGTCLATGSRPYQPLGVPVEAPRQRSPERVGDRDER